MKCDCNANYGKDCLFPEEYDTTGCTSGEHGCKSEEDYFELIDYYDDPEYYEKMDELEKMMLGGNVE